MNKKYLLYVGLFVAGAVITPLYLSLFGAGDRPSTSDTEQTEFTDDINVFNTEDSVSMPAFAPDDSRELIEQDYMQRSSKTATALPQFAREQSPPAPYPNYAAIPAPKISVPETVIPQPAIAPSNNKSPQSTGDTLTGLNQDRAIAIDSAAPFKSSVRSVSANTLFTPQAQSPTVENSTDNAQSNWLRNNANKPTTGSNPLAEQ